jgi:hypothetical protein
MTCVCWPGRARIITFWQNRLWLDNTTELDVEDPDTRGLTEIESYVTRTIRHMDRGLYILCGDDRRTTNLVSRVSSDNASDLFSFDDLLLRMKLLEGLGRSLDEHPVKLPTTLDLQK